MPMPALPGLEDLIRQHPTATFAWIADRYRELRGRRPGKASIVRARARLGLAAVAADRRGAIPDRYSPEWDAILRRRIAAVRSEKAARGERSPAPDRTPRVHRGDFMPHPGPFRVHGHILRHEGAA